MRKKALFILTLILAISILLPCAKAAADETLKIYKSTVEFRHFYFETDENNMIVNYDKNKTVKTTFNTIVIENPFIKVTLLPEYGGRILSIIYKPTGHEMLYQNPVGAPYGIKEGNFYYDWLMVYGGIFPTFPEPEHGKAWCLPWESEIIEQSDEKISVEMKFTDTISSGPNVPGKFDNGRTDLTLISTVTVYRDKSYVDYNIRLVNNKNEPVNYEYWTCVTFAPGSEPNNTYCSPDTEIVAPISKVLLKDDWWPWMGSAEKAISKSNHVFEYNNLAHFNNWKDMGIAYAYPEVSENWWGVINHENEVGLLRIADNKNSTPGLKFWTWGIGSKDVNPETFENPARPYIELWAGHSPQFFADTKIGPNEEKAWTEHYIPTIGMSKVTHANENAAIYLNHAPDEKKENILFNAEIFATHPNEVLKVSLSLEGKTSHSLLEETIEVNPTAPAKYSVPLPLDKPENGEYTYQLILSNDTGEILAQAQIPFNTEDCREATKDSEETYAGPELPAASSSVNDNAGIWYFAVGAVIILLILSIILVICIIKYRKGHVAK